MHNVPIVVQNRSKRCSTNDGKTPNEDRQRIFFVYDTKFRVIRFCKFWDFEAEKQNVTQLTQLFFLCRGVAYEIRNTLAPITDLLSTNCCNNKPTGERRFHPKNSKALH